MPSPLVIADLTPVPAPPGGGFVAAGAGLQTGACLGALTISGVLLNGPAWDIVDLVALWIAFDVRGTDRPIPLVPGMKAYRRRMTATRHSLPMVVTGAVDRLGAPYADKYVGLETNLKYLYDNVVKPTGVTDGTRPASLLMPSGATRTANLHVLNMQYDPTGRVEHLMRATLEISIPSGIMV